MDWDCILGTCTNVGTGLGTYISYAECIAYGCEGTPTTTTTTEAPTTTTTTSTTAAPGGDTFYVLNVDGTGTVTEVTSGGFEFAFITNGSYPLSAGQSVSGGQGSLSSANVDVGIFNPSVNGCIVLEINNIPIDSVPVSGGGTYTFYNVTFSSTDIVQFSYYSGECP